MPSSIYGVTDIQLRLYVANHLDDTLAGNLVLMTTLLTLLVTQWHFTRMTNISINPPWILSWEWRWIFVRLVLIVLHLVLKQLSWRFFFIWLASSMRNLLHVSKEALHIFILSMGWENYPRFFCHSDLCLGCLNFSEVLDDYLLILLWLLSISSPCSGICTT